MLSLIIDIIRDDIILEIYNSNKEEINNEYETMLTSYLISVPEFACVNIEN